MMDASTMEYASKKPTALPIGYMFVLTLYGIPIIGLLPKLLFMSVIYLANSGVILYRYMLTLSPSSKDISYTKDPSSENEPTIGKIYAGRFPTNETNSGPLTYKPESPAIEYDVHLINELLVKESLMPMLTR